MSATETAAAGSAANSTGTPLDTALAMLEQFTVMTPGQTLLAALWSAHSHCYAMWPATPRLFLCSDRPGSGKTAIGQIVAGMSHDPLQVAYASPASVYSWLSEHRDTTIFVDEADMHYGRTGRRTAGKSTLLAVMNAGAYSNGQVLVMRGGAPTRMAVFSPMILAGLGTLPDALLSRSLVLQVAPAVPAAVYLPAVHDPELALVGQQVATWLSKPATRRALACAPDLAPVPGSPRFRQLCACLYAIADAAGMADRFTAAIAELQDSMAGKQTADRAELAIADLVSLWPEDRAMLRPAEVIGLLRSHDSARWSMLTDDVAGMRVLAGILGEREISTHARNGLRGYARADLFR